MQKMPTYDDIRKEYHLVFKTFWLFKHCLCYLVYAPSFKSMAGTCSKKVGGDINNVFL